MARPTDGPCEFCPHRPGPCCVCGGWAEADDKDGCGGLVLWAAIAALVWTVFLAVSMLG